MRGPALAADLWRRYELGAPVDLRYLAGELGVQVVSFPFGGRLREVIIGRTIGVQPGLTRPWFRWYVAHAMGHHLLHAGAGVHTQPWQSVENARAERQAGEFAASLMAGPDGWRLGASELGIPSSKLSLVRNLASPAGHGPCVPVSR